MAIRLIETLTTASWDIRLDVQVSGWEIVVPDAEIMIDGTSYSFEETRYDVTPNPDELVIVQGHLCLDTETDTPVLLVEEGAVGDFVEYDFPSEDPYLPIAKYTFLMRVPAGAATLEEADCEVRIQKPDNGGRE